MGVGGCEGRMVVQRKTVISLVEVIVVIVCLAAIVQFFLAVTSSGVPNTIRYRVMCGTNLKYLGAAMCAYANDYKDQFPQLPGTGPWSKKLGFEFDLAKPDFSKGGLHSAADRTITASLYLLVKYADVLPKDFKCPADNNVTQFDGRNLKQLDSVELWDFGAEPYKHVSYAMHNPYGAYPATAKLSAIFAIAGDMSPWFRQGDFVKPDSSFTDWGKNTALMSPYFSVPSTERWQIQQANAFSHNREGQNVAFADGHLEYVKTSDVGVKHDNIYTYWSAPENPTDADRRIGTNPTTRDKDNDAKSADDSFLAI
jgi:prepilin-type processing-associated H-X9-DG protein